MKTRQILCWLLFAASPALAQVSPWSSGTYAYDGSGNVKAIGADYYVYDQVGRLVRGTADKERSGLESYQAYTYDAFGNRLTASTIGTQCVNGCGVNVQVSNNRVTDHGAAYDAAGNLKHFDTNYYTYDGNGMLVTVSSSPSSADAQYIYTADDERLAIYTGGGNWRFTIRDLDAKVVREVTAFQSGGTTTWTWHRDHVFRDGQLLATVLPEGTQHYHLDHLGTPRLVTDGIGRKLGVHVYYPFGDELNLGLGEQTSSERLKYTGHERDDASNGTSLDDMHARYYSSIQGRFLSVDPVLDVKRTITAPQGWNRYTYSNSNPVNFTDPTGKEVDTIGTAIERRRALAYIKFLLHNRAAAKFVTMDDSGQIGISGMSVADWSAKFGGNAAKLGALIQSTYRLSVGIVDRSVPGGGRFDPAGKRQGVLLISAGDFPEVRFGTMEYLDTVLAHEFYGHAMMAAGLIDEDVGSIHYGKHILYGIGLNEAEGIWAENAYRRQVGLPARPYYAVPGDYIAPGGH